MHHCDEPCNAQRKERNKAKQRATSQTPQASLSMLNVKVHRRTWKHWGSQSCIGTNQMTSRTMSHGPMRPKWSSFWAEIPHTWLSMEEEGWWSGAVLQLWDQHRPVTEWTISSSAHQSFLEACGVHLPNSQSSVKRRSFNRTMRWTHHLCHNDFIMFNPNVKHPHCLSSKSASFKSDISRLPVNQEK